MRQPLNDRERWGKGDTLTFVCAALVVLVYYLIGRF